MLVLEIGVAWSCWYTCEGAEYWYCGVDIGRGGGLYPWLVGGDAYAGWNGW
jgi:hypothetical protein